MDHAIVIKVIETTPSLLWWMFVTIVLVIFYRPIRDELIPRMTGLKVLGVDFIFVSRQLDEVAKVERSAAGTKEARDQVARRAERIKSLVNGSNIMLVNDQPVEMRYVIAILRRLGAVVDVRTSTDDALRAVVYNTPDVIISDMARPEGADAGLQLLSQLRAQEHPVPVIFSVGKNEPDRGNPPFAFGITNRVDELLNLTFDVIERARG